jgi:hypothetical protein
MFADPTHLGFGELVGEHHIIRTWLKRWSYLTPALSTVYITHGYDPDVVEGYEIRTTFNYCGSSSFWEKGNGGTWTLKALDDSAAERANKPDPFGF